MEYFTLFEYISEHAQYGIYLISRLKLTLPIKTEIVFSTNRLGFV